MVLFRFLLTAFVLCVDFATSFCQRDKVPMDVVFTLDLSASTNGLVDDVRDHLWDIVNQVNTYRPDVDLRIGIVAFSRPSFGRENGYVKILCDLTGNYELPALELARLKPSVEKGDQLVGVALKTSVLGMKWSTSNSAIKVIFLTGNGNVNLDGIKYREAYEEAAKQKIIINTIYCFSSNYQKDIFGWKEIAKYSGGVQYDMRVHHRNPLIVTCTEKEKFNDLAQQLSDSYIYYGKYGVDVRRMIDMIDRTAMDANPQAFQSRMFYKISGNFQSKQYQWDLVDYMKKTNSDFREIDFEYLPDSLKYFTPEKLRNLVMLKKDERLRIISQMRGLLKFDRQQIINKVVKEKEYDINPNTFDRIVISWLNKAASEKGITCFVN